MKPAVTFLTSSELQGVIGEELSEEEEEDLQAFRDRLLKSFTNLDEALEKIEDIYGRGWKSFDPKIWVFDGKHDSVSSPILLRQKDIEVSVFEAYWMLAKRLIREDPPESPLVEDGYGKLDAVSALLASQSLKRVMDRDGYREVMDAVRSDAEDLKTWRKMDDFREGWRETEKTLYEWLEDT